MSAIEEIKARLDIVDIVSETVQLKKSGKSFTGFCPFHANTRTPSFVVWPDSGTWKCFGSCNEGGDIFKFMMKREGWDFAEALRHLANKAGVVLETPNEAQQQRREEHERLRGLLEEAVAFFRHHLLETPDGKIALDYLRGRHLSDETIEVFELGYAPKGWDNIIQHFTEKGYTEEELLEAGLISENEKGRRYDRFRHRVIFPIRDHRKLMAGFGARAIDPDDVPKYLNSPQTAVFDKSALLYGLDKARQEIRGADQVVIVEGYLDVIAPYQAGYKNLVSPMGTALTEAQLRMLKKLTRRIILALDADSAGANATLRGLQVARSTMDREADPTFDARGLVRNEGRLQADIRVTTLPEGLDPDEVVQQDPVLWEELINNAKPVVVHVMDTLAEGQNLNDPKVKTDIAAQVMPLIEDVPSAIERDAYVQQLARLLKVDERALLSDRTSRQPRRRPVQRREPQEAPPDESKPYSERQIGSLSPAAALSRLEGYILGIIMRLPDLMYKVDRSLKEAGLERISSQDFQSTNHQIMFRVALESLDQDFLEPLNFALDHLPMPLIEVADDILEQTQTLDPNEDRVLDDLLRAILNLRRLNLRINNDQLRFLQEEAHEQGDAKASQYLQTMVNITHTLHQLDKALARHSNRSMAAH